MSPPTRGQRPQGLCRWTLTRGFRCGDARHVRVSVARPSTVEGIRLVLAEEVLQPRATPRRITEPRCRQVEVPAWPTLRWPKSLRTTATTSWEVGPAGLSTRSIPCTNALLRPGREMLARGL